MPSFKYGARQFQISANLATASTAANSTVGEYQYMPAMDGAKYGTIDFASEQVKQATLVFLASVAQANSTAAGGSVLVAASQFNSLGASQNSATLYNQAVASQAAFVPIDVSTKLSTWTLSPGDQIVLFVNSNTVGIPASFPTLVLSGTIDAVTAF
jgi:phosphoribosylamine-glycine ligase